MLPQSDVASQYRNNHSSLTPPLPPYVSNHKPATSHNVKTTISHSLKTTITQSHWGNKPLWKARHLSGVANDAASREGEQFFPLSSTAQILLGHKRLWSSGRIVRSNGALAVPHRYIGRPVVSREAPSP
ncbi:hypothetical protein RRG08_018744 [Elysia crispata]|uniref:Uncharacterized protein n=1 Tax=Elysia crispata TaxID=231223 RepID=A0AAE0XUE5_9GAST|nr:hypothetical protein RRG08_018744 [Elysia crispata]